METTRAAKPLLTALALAAGAALAPAQEHKLGAYDSEVPGFASPADAVFVAGDTTLVLEADLDRVTAIQGDGTTAALFGGSGDGPGQFRDPRAMELGPDGRLYIADTGNHRIEVFEGPRFEFALSIGSFGRGLGDLASPLGLAVTETEIFVADSLNNRIAVFDLDGHATRAFGTRGSGPGELSRPTDVAVDAEGNAYVTDSWNHRVQKFDAAGEHVLSWGDFGPHPGFFATPMGITHHAGELFVADRDNHRIQVFDTAGELLYAWGLHAIRPRESEGKLHYPIRIAIAPDGVRATVVEGVEDRVQSFAATVDGAEPPAAGSLDRSVSVHYGGSVDSAGGWMTLVEPTRPAALIWDDATTVAELEPISVSRVSSWGRGFGQFRMPVDTAIDVERSLLYVADPGNLRIAAWSIERDEGPIKYQPDLLRLAFSIDLAKLPCEFEHPGPIVATALELGHGGELEDSLLVADASTRSVIEIGSSEGVLAAWLQWPSADDTPLLEATDVALSPGGHTLYVADRVAGCVRAFPHTEGGQTFTFRGPEDDPLVRPAGLCVDGAGFIYVTDEALHRVAKFAPTGERLATWGRQGLGALEFFKPRGIAVRADGHLVVLDHGNHRAQILSTDGEFLHVFGSLLFIEPAQR